MIELDLGSLAQWTRDRDSLLQQLSGALSLAQGLHLLESQPEKVVEELTFLRYQLQILAKNSEEIQQRWYKVCDALSLLPPDDDE